MNKNHRVLIVDDDIDFVEQLDVVLSKAGFSVVKAMSKAEAEKLLDEQAPDIAIVDLMMENPDAGFVLCYKIKTVNPNIPVILVTSVSSETNIEFNPRTQEEKDWIKADAFLSKPIRFEQLKREMERLLGV